MRNKQCNEAPDVIVCIATHKKILPLRDTIKKKTLQRIKYTKKNPKFP
jgi:hypothetical protein